MELVDARFAYSPLDDPEFSIRTLEVLPDLVDGRIQAVMRHSGISAGYHALSYCWGEGQEKCEILLNHRLMLVRRNLHDFLETARRRLPGQHLWIDALCINQDDNVEKSHQVQRMGRIYQEASGVLVWLGNRPHLDYVFSFITELVKTNASTSTISSMLDLAGPEGVDSGLKQICTHPYWHRAWIAQEILLAQHVRILTGSRQTEWRSLIRTIKEVRKYLPKQFNEVFYSSAILKFWDEWPWHVPHSRLRLQKRSIWKLDWVWASQCSDPRDRIYSLLALLEDHHFQVDYGEDLCSLFWRAGEHFRAWNGTRSLKNLSEALNITSSALEQSRSSNTPRHLSLTAANIIFPDEWDPGRTVCEYCGARLDNFIRTDVSLCIQDHTGNRESQHAILRPTSSGSFTIILRSGYPTRMNVTRKLGTDALQRIFNGRSIGYTQIPFWKDDVPGSEFRIRVPVEFVLEDLKGLERYKESR